MAATTGSPGKLVQLECLRETRAVANTPVDYGNDRATLALVHALKKWMHYLMGSTVLVYTDDVALKYWRTAENVSNCQVRWLAYIGMFDIEITSVTNTAAYAISRRVCHAIAVNDDWKLDYMADTKRGPQLFDEADVARDPQHFHHGRVCDFDQTVVHRRRVRHVIAEAHSNVTFGHLDQYAPTTF